MNEIIDQRKILAIDKLIEGELNRKAIAEFVGISRSTLYEWLNDDEFVAEWNRRVQLLKSFAEKKIEARVEFSLDNLMMLAADTSNKRVQAQVNMYLIDRALGKPTSKIDLESGIKTTPTDVDILHNEFEEIDNS